MKYLFLFAFTCGVFSNCFSQIQVSEKNKSAEKWEITPTIDAIEKGKLNVDYPADALWTILVGSPVNKQTLKYVTSAQYPVELTPGDYYIEFTNVPIGIVPFKLGMETRLRTGILHVISEGTWTIYDKLKKTYYKTGTTPQKIILPVGEYQVKIGSKFYKLAIRDGETAELVPVGPTGIKIAEVKRTTENSPNNSIVNAEQYIMSPMAEDSINSKATTGLLWLIPNQLSFTGQLIYYISVFKAGQSTDAVFTCSYSSQGSDHCWPNTSLPAGTYDIYLGASYVNSGVSCASSCRNLVLHNIPIRNGYETKLKYGYLQRNINAQGICQIFDASNQTGYHTYLPTSPLPYPVGRYVVHQLFVGRFPIEITDGKTTILNPIDSAYITAPKWITHAIVKSPSLNKGRLNAVFPEKNLYHHMTIKVPNPNTNLGYSIITLNTVRTIDLVPGNYEVTLNYVPMRLPIEAGKETKIKYGFLDIKAPGTWNLKNILTGAGHGGNYNNDKIIALPIGYYKLVVGINSFLIKVNKGETLVFDYGTYFSN